MRNALLLVCLVTALALSACAVPPGQAAPAAAPQSAPAQQGIPPQARTISVNGVGQVTLAPDVAYVSIGVHSQSDNVSEALSQNNQKAQAVAGALRELGIDPKDVQTSGFNVVPQQEFGPQGEQLGIVYSVDNTVYVTVRDLQILGQLLDVVVRSGANSINGIAFDVLDKSKGLAEARQLAVESAQSQAAEMAQYAGVTLGELQTMNVYTSSPPTPIFEGKGGVGMDAAQVPISAGQVILRVEVGAVYAIQ
ncbi:MAG: DUF541 domain-containing protein [Chloroflexi bacterium]|nr:MAG: DUF541 domain-containing protein [Chloroflexota bacterium]